ncbi:MAG TPA: hypothetical protein VMC85_02270 [Desulfomonilaceae bacterium]|nr:hypothetical protein [Desulfomonilaceae bacterium]
MSGKYFFSAWVALLLAILIVQCAITAPAQAYRICTFKGTVIDNGWRSMTVKSGNQCAEVNVGWRTKYMPNRRPCIGERVAVDFMLEDGYMKATKVVSLTPPVPEAQCFPPAPPSGTVCGKPVAEEVVTDTCARPRAICSTKPPAHVADRNWVPKREVLPPKPAKPEAKKPPAEKAPKKVAEAPVEGKEEPKERVPAPEEKRYKSLSGEVVASSPKSLSIRVTEEGEAAEVVNVRVGLKTKFVPFRRPAVGEKVKVEYMQENGDKFGYTVQVVQ